MMQVKITVHLRESILDPRCKVINDTLHTVGYKSVNNVILGNEIILDITGDDENEILKISHDIAKEIFVNEVMENYTIELI